MNILLLLLLYTQLVQPILGGITDRPQSGRILPSDYRAYDEDLIRLAGTELFAHTSNSYQRASDAIVPGFFSRAHEPWPAAVTEEETGDPLGARHCAACRRSKPASAFYQ